MHNRKDIVMLEAIRMYLEHWPISSGARDFELTPNQREDRKIAHTIREELEFAVFGKVPPCHCIECLPRTTGKRA